MADNKNYAVSEIIGIVLMVVIVVSISAAIYAFNAGIVGTSATDDKPVYASFISTGQNGNIKLLLVDPGEDYPTGGFTNVVVYVEDEEVQNMSTTVELGRPIIIERIGANGYNATSNPGSNPLPPDEYNIRVVILEHLVHDNTLTVY
jgi:hypothetical protein